MLRRSRLGFCWIGKMADKVLEMRKEIETDGSLMKRI